MELLLAAAGLAGLAALLQSRPSVVPSEKDFLKAQEKLGKDPGDADASAVVGRYLMFVRGDYSGAMPHLAKSSDKVLSPLATNELTPGYTDNGPQKVGMGDEWVAAAKKMPAMSRVFYDRAAQWYVLAWPDLSVPWQDMARIQGRKLAVARPSGAPRRQLPPGWIADPGVSGKPPYRDGSIARSGSYSVRMPWADDKVKGSISSVKSDIFPVTGNRIRASAYVFSDGNENKDDRLFVWFLGPQGNLIGGGLIGYIPDIPFWNRITMESDVPGGATKALVGVSYYSKKGILNVDDFSVRFDDGKEVLKNGSFDA